LLAKWKRREGLNNVALAERLGVGAEAVRRYQLAYDHPEYQVPLRDTMVRIFEVTGGKVKPNDFYPLPRVLAA